MRRDVPHAAQFAPWATYFERQKGRPKKRWNTHSVPGDERDVEIRGAGGGGTYVNKGCDRACASRRLGATTATATEALAGFKSTTVAPLGMCMGTVVLLLLRIGTGSMGRR